MTELVSRFCTHFIFLFFKNFLVFNTIGDNDFCLKLNETTRGFGHAIFLLHARVFYTQGSWYCTVLLYSKKIFQTIFLFLFFF